VQRQVRTKQGVGTSEGRRMMALHVQCVQSPFLRSARNCIVRKNAHGSAFSANSCARANKSEVCEQKWAQKDGSAPGAVCAWFKQALLCVSIS
jgi:hypothetical protein